MKRLTILLLVPVLSWSQGANAAASDCAAIENASERLACFDRAFPKNEPVPEAPPAPVQAPPPPEPVADVPVPPAEVEQTVEVIPEPPPRERTKKAAKPKQVKEKEKKPGFFNRGDKEVIAATVVEMMNKNKQRMVFRLSNDQVWIQTSPRNLPISVGDDVTIKEGTIGGHILRNDNGISTRVRLIPAS